MPIENDTIAALATPAGESAIGIVRVSGPQTDLIVSSIFVANKAKNQHAGRILGWVKDPATTEKIDQVIIHINKAPDSYTGEDTAEIQCHGGLCIINTILDLALLSGARLAERGEFTKRAFLNGKIDLIKAESVIELIRAKTTRGVKAAALRMSGGETGKIENIDETLRSVLAQIEASTDFPDDIPDPEPRDLLSKLEKSIQMMEEILSHSETSRMLSDGVKIAITGKPNSGKSTLLNAILREERAIVTDIPGTTTDTIEETVSIAGFPIRFIDTAGMRIPGNEIEEKGIERSSKAITDADIVIMVFDGSLPISSEDKIIMAKIEEKKNIRVINKIDIIEQKIDRAIIGEAIMISAVNGTGIKDIEERIRTELEERGSRDRIYANTRQTQCILAARDAIIRAIDTIKTGYPPDTASIDVRDAIISLGEATGTQVSQEIIDQIFSSFCVGK